MGLFLLLIWLKRIGNLWEQSIYLLALISFAMYIWEQLTWSLCARTIVGTVYLYAKCEPLIIKQPMNWVCSFSRTNFTVNSHRVIEDRTPKFKNESKKHYFLLIIQNQIYIFNITFFSHQFCYNLNCKCWGATF